MGVMSGIRKVWSGPPLSPGLDITGMEVQIADLAPEFDGFTIAHISDLHIGRGRWDTPDAKEAIETVRAASPDVVVNTGDYLWREAPINKVARESAGFLASGDAEVQGPRNLAIFGNHDYYAGEDTIRALTEALQRQGVCLLVNRAVQVRKGAASLSFVGITDEEPGVADGIESLEASPRPRVALIHKPDLARYLPHASADLMLAGHTHGGQVTVPGLEARIVKRFCGSDYVQGMYEINGMPVYVNRGLGCTGLPLRVRAAPEVTFIRLVR